MRLNCITAAAVSALLMAIAVFLGNVGHTEYKSQMRKRKVAKIEQVILDDTTTDTSEDLNVQLV
jgi:hypothetical protein